MINVPIGIMVLVAIIIIGYYAIILTRKSRQTNSLSVRKVKCFSLFSTVIIKLKNDIRCNDKVTFTETSNISEDSFFYKLKKSRLTGPLGLVLALFLPAILLSVSWNYSFLAVIGFVLSLILSYIGAFKGPKGIYKGLSILGLIILLIHTFSAAAMLLFGYLMASAY